MHSPKTPKKDFKNITFLKIKGDTIFLGAGEANKLADYC